MSRAFVSENDGWSRCAKYLETCMFADSDGKCVLKQCRLHSKETAENQKEA